MREWDGKWQRRVKQEDGQHTLPMDRGQRAWGRARPRDTAAVPARNCRNARPTHAERVPPPPLGHWTAHTAAQRGAAPHSSSLSPSLRRREARRGNNARTAFGFPPARCSQTPACRQPRVQADPAGAACHFGSPQSHPAARLVTLGPHLIKLSIGDKRAGWCKAEGRTATESLHSADSSSRKGQQRRIARTKCGPINSPNNRSEAVKAHPRSSHKRRRP